MNMDNNEIEVMVADPSHVAYVNTILDTRELGQQAICSNIWSNCAP